MSDLIFPLFYLQIVGIAVSFSLNNISPMLITSLISGLLVWSQVSP